MEKIIRRANKNDIDRVNDLLLQVKEIHRRGRPDIFKAGIPKYTDDELKTLFSDDSRPVFVIEIDGRVEGYCFCIFRQAKNDNVLTDVKTLYIDDLCVDSSSRGNHLGTDLYRYVIDFAKKNGCYNVTLNVWECNENAKKFYTAMGLKPRRTEMETIL